MASHQPPASRPPPSQQADVVLYDGRCGFCRARIGQLRWLDGSAGRLEYVSLHEPGVAGRWPEASPERLLEEMAVVDRRTGRLHWGAEAVRYLSRRLPRLWWLAPVMHLPGVMLVAKPIYAWVSRNRYLLGGKAEDCENGACKIG